MANQVESIRIIEPHTISVVERWKFRNGFPAMPATKAAAKMIERLDALESSQPTTAAAGGTQGSAGKDSKDQSLPSPVTSGN